MKLKPILPKKRLPKDSDIQRAIDMVMDNAAYDAMSLFQDTVKTWNDRPSFYLRKIGNGREVGTKSKIFTFVDQGTKPHIIRPKRAGGVLRFKAGGFKAKTSPGRLASNRGAPGRTWVSSKGVQHPGTKAREFSAKIAARMNKEIAKEMRKALKGLVK